MIENENYYKNQNREQREILLQQEERIKALKKENYEIKQSVYDKLILVRNIGKSNNMYKNIKMLDIVEELSEEMKKEKELDVSKTN